MEHHPEVKAECVIRWLDHLKASVGAISSIERQIARIRESVDLVAAKERERVRGGEQQDRLSEALARIEELQAEWAQTMEDNAQEVGEAIGVCTATREAQCVWMHYMDGVPWDGVAQAMGFSPSHARGKARREGISHIYARMPEEWRRELPNAVSIEYI